MALETELKTYEAHLAELLEQKGRYAVVHRDRVLGTFADYGDALDAAYREFGTRPFLVKKIEQVETPQRFTSTFGPCPI